MIGQHLLAALNTDVKGWNTVKNVRKLPDWFYNDTVSCSVCRNSFFPSGPDRKSKITNSHFTSSTGVMLLENHLIFWSLVITPLLYLLYNSVVFIIDVQRRGKAVDQFPGEKRHWLWGHLHLFPGLNEQGLKYAHGLMDKYSHCAQFCFGMFEPNVWVWHYESVKKILRTSEPKPAGMGIYGFGKPWIGDGLLLSRGKKWARNRRLLTPAFHFDILKPYMKINNYCIEMLLDKMTKYAETGESFEFFSNISLCTLDVILRCAMSYETDVQLKGEDHPYIQSVTRLGDLWLNRVFSPWKHVTILYKLSKEGREFKKHCDYVHTISRDVILKRQKVLAENGSVNPKKRCLDFLDILLTARDEDGNGLTFSEIQDEVDTFLFEGHDTTASALSWTVYSLAEHPEYQRKCQEEIDEILNGRDSEEITWDDLPKFKYLTQCLKEAMRLHTPVPFISRVLTKDMTIDGKTLPKNSVIDIHIYNLHHNPLIWKDDMVYDPSRFDPDKVEKMDSFAFVPFSAGPRNCIGQNFAMHEMKTALARIFRRFDVSLDPDFKVEKKVSLVMKTSTGIKVKLHKRSH